MKTLRFINTGLFAILLSFTFVACGDDEEEYERPNDPTTENPTPVPEPETSKKLVKIVEKEGEIREDYIDEGIRTYTFNYDSRGNVISALEYQDEYDNTICNNFDYTNDSIITFNFKLDGDYGEKVTFGLSNNKIIYAKREDLEDGSLWYEFNYEYNSSNQLTQYYQSSIGHEYLIWSGNKLIESNGDFWEFEDKIYEYGNKTCKGYNPILVFEYCNIFLPIVAKPELLGLKTNELPTSYYEGGDIAKCTYEFYDDGYLKKCTMSWVDEFGIADEYSEYTFIWE